MVWVPPSAVGIGRQVAPASAHGAEGQAAGVEIFRETRREDLEAIKGAQHGGTVRGFGGINGDKERGKRRWLAERNSSAVAKVIAKATANLS